jgi:hypothetical protein
MHHPSMDLNYKFQTVVDPSYNSSLNQSILNVSSNMDVTNDSCEPKIVFIRPKKNKKRKPLIS